jgi:hypothetical protein
MLEMLLYKKRGSVAYNPAGIIGRSVRLVGLGGVKSNYVGVNEFELLDAQGRNLCRTAGFIPATGFSPNAKNSPSSTHVADYDTYPVSKTIDGVSNIWTSTAYMTCIADGTAWLQYDFAQDVSSLLSKWRMKPEGTWLPTEPGMKLMIYTANGWKEIRHSSSSSSAWSGTAFRDFNGLTIAP